MTLPENPLVGKAADTALELMKQLITLSSGILALSATFIDHFRWSSWWHLLILLFAWSSLVIAVLMGLETISAIVKTRLQPDEHDWSLGRGLLTARLSKYGFVIGLAAFALFAFLTLFSSTPVNAPKNDLPGADVLPSRDAAPPSKSDAAGQNLRFPAAYP